jgi:uncharacterized membrane protein
MQRLLIVDNLRGIAFIFMIIQHIFYFYDLSTLYKTTTANNPFISFAGAFARHLFIFLAGFSLVLNYNHNKAKFKKKKIYRTLEILTHAALISLVSYIYYPNNFIRFGILHFIAIATLLCSFIAPYPKFYLLFFAFSLIFKPPKINEFIDTITGASVHFNMLDYFPLFKWLPLLISGMIVSSNINLTNLNLVNSRILNSNNILTYLGKNSLNLYTSHVVIFIIFFYYLQNNKLK